MFCEKCGAQLPEGTKFCSKCGNRIWVETNPQIEESPMTSKGTEMEKEEKKVKKKSKVKRVLIIILLLLVVLVMGAGVLVIKWYTSAEQSILRALEEGNYDEAVALYADDYEGGTESIQSTLSDRLERIKTEYTSGNMEYAVAIMELDAISKMNISAINRTISDTRVYINSLNQSRMAFDTAEKYFEEGDYLDAIQQYKLVSEDDSNYDVSKDKLTESIDKYREQILTEAEGLAANGSYQDAMNKVKDALDVIPNDAKLQPEYNKYSSDYVDSVLTEVDGLVENADYDGAITKINAALNVVGKSEELEGKLEEVKGKKPISLSSLAPINGGWSWNEGTPVDPFGVTYSSASNFVILNKTSSDAKYTGENINTGKNLYGIYESYAEYRIYGEYTQFSFDVVPNSVIGEDQYGTVKVYADDTLIFSSPQITRKTDLQTYQVDVSNADYIKIIVNTTTNNDCVLLMNCTLSK